MKQLNGKILALGKTCMILFAFLALLFYLPPQATCSGTPLQTIFANPFSVNGTAVGIGNTVTVNINITNGLNVWSWGAGFKFNPAVLNCTNVFEGEFLKRSGLTLWMAGAINNTKGEAATTSSSCTSGNLPVSGSGQLMYATFKVKATGISDIHLLNVVTATKIGTSVVASPCQVLDKYTLLVDSGKYIVSLTHNATGTTKPACGIPNLILDKTAKSVIFNMTCPKALVFCNVTIPKTLLSGTWTVKVAGSTVTPQKTEDTTNTYIYFTTSSTATTTKKVEIIGTTVVPEFQPTIMLPLILALLAIAILTAKRKLRRGKTQWQIQTPTKQL